MSYVVLARKYRPMNFAELRGQDHVARTLQNAIRVNRLSHAYLFTGPRGVGKTTTARVLAKAVNCEEGLNPEPCNRCRSCLEVNEGRSLDVIEIDGASNRRIEEVRELRETVKYAPAASRFKVYIIDEVHMLTAEAFNALLKTLEEPPAHVKFILATTAAEKVPSTIQSRCQRFDFRLLTREEMIVQLERIIAQEGLSLSRRILNDIARAAEGSMRDALSLLDQVLSFAGQEPDDIVVEQVLHLVRGDVLDRFLQGVARRDAADLIRVVDELAARGLDMRRFLQELLEWVRGLMLVSVSPALADLIPLAVEDRQILCQRATEFSRGRLRALVETLIDAERDLRQADSPRYVMELVALKMAETADFDSLEQLTGRLERLGRQFEGPSGESGWTSGKPPAAFPPTGKVAPTAEQSAGEESPLPAPHVLEEEGREEETYLELTGEEAPETGPPAERSDWERFLEEVKKRRMHLGLFLEHGRMTGRDERSMVIGFTRSQRLFYESAQEKDHLAIISEAAIAVFGERFRVRLELAPEEEKDSVPGAPRETDLMKKRQREALKNPLVQDILDAFGGQVTDVKILRSLRDEGGSKS